MSRLEHRLQILIDSRQKAALDAESAKTGRSIGSLVRSAIDVQFTYEHAARAAALASLLDRSASVDEVEDDWDVIKAELLAAIDRRVP